MALLGPDLAEFTLKTHSLSPQPAESRFNASIPSAIIKRDGYCIDVLPDRFFHRQFSCVMISNGTKPA
ncbi:hypothetical protein B0G80_2019 [Paraburkholderia sp. BL6669N2]|nr:hypothetical protein B0G80_2019 [Paraburkholderia sp. BL6669N2]